MSTAAAPNVEQLLARFPVDPGETVTAWALSPVSARYFPGEAAPAEDRVNYHFINGFVDVGDLPCRVALWKDVAERRVCLKTDWPVESINLPGFNRRLEFSDFWHRPTRLRRWCRTVLEPETDGDFRFELATCGGVHIWVDGVLAAKFEPYSRNRQQECEVTLPLKAGGSEVVLLSEELAERDTNWYVELTLKGSIPLASAVPGSADAAVVDELMALARDVRPQGEFITGGPLILEFDRAVTSDVRVSAEVLPGVHMRDKPPLLSTGTVLKSGEMQAAIDGIDTMPDGYHALNLSFAIGETRVRRQIAFALLRDTAPKKFAGDLDERKRTALAFAAENGEWRIGRALAILAASGEATDACIDIIEDTLRTIDERRDCSDFVMVPLLWLFGAYRDKLPAQLAQRIRKTVLNYRYWVDEPGNDVMWFWSENHVLCFHVSQYLAGLMLPDGEFTTSGRTGAEQQSLAETRLARWFASVEQAGLAEWNSAAYYPIDFIGLLALQHWGGKHIAGRAEALLDRLFRMIALHTLTGVPAGSMGRAYDKELRAGPLTELAPFASVGFGEGWLNEGVAALPMFCAGSYNPPAGYCELVFPAEGEAVSAHYVQGHDTAARLALYKTRTVQLSASVDGTPGGHGHQQHLMDIRFAAHPFARAWINHPGEDDPWGHQRPSYWAGNGSMPSVGQHGNAALMLYDIPGDDRTGFTHAYAPLDAFDEWAIHGHWLILRSGAGYAALTPCDDIQPVTTGPGRRREFRSHGRKAAWATIVGDLEAGATLASITEMLDGTAAAFDPDRMTLALKRPGKPLLTLDYASGLYVDGKACPFPTPHLEPQYSIGQADVLRPSISKDL